MFWQTTFHSVCLPWQFPPTSAYPDLHFVQQPVSQLRQLGKWHSAAISHMRTVSGSLSKLKKQRSVIYTFIRPSALVLFASLCLLTTVILLLQ